MIFGQYKEIEVYKNTLSDPVWERAFTWIQNNARVLPDGEHEIQEKEMYANIQSFVPVPASDPTAAFEVHEEYIDIHYCLSGAEGIGYEPVGTLEEKELNKEKDYRLFFPTKLFNICDMQPDTFAIFFPQELHMPKLQNGSEDPVKKVVIKIKASMLGSWQTH